MVAEMGVRGMPITIHNRVLVLVKSRYIPKEHIWLLVISMQSRPGIQRASHHRMVLCWRKSICINFTPDGNHLVVTTYTGDFDEELPEVKQIWIGEQRCGSTILIPTVQHTFVRKQNSNK